MTMNKLIIDNESGKSFLNEIEVDTYSLQLFEPDVMVPTGYERRVYYSNFKHYLKSDKDTKSLDIHNEKFDDLFSKIEEIIEIDKKVREGSIKPPCKYVG